MEIRKTQTGGADILTLIGRLDATTAPKLQEALLEVIPRSEKLELDFAGVDYVSSAGLRVLLFIEKNVKSAGKIMTLLSDAWYRRGEGTNKCRKEVMQD